MEKFKNLLACCKVLHDIKYMVGNPRLNITGNEPNLIRVGR